MARPLRIEYEGALHHVMNRGNASQSIFESPDDYRMFIDILVESIKLWEINIHAFSLLPNHYHLLIETPRANLSRAMRHINGVYTQRFNRNKRSDGHLFRGRYKAILVDEEAYLVELIRYIHNNPVRAGLVTQPEKHPWTSHKDYLKVGDRKWLTTDRLLSYFGKRKNLARRKLHEFVMQGVPEELAKRLSSPKLPSVLSSKNFEEWIQWNFVKDIDNEHVQYEPLHVRNISERRLRKVLCELLDVKWEDLVAPAGLIGKQNRATVIQFYRQYLKLTYDQLSEIFNLKPARISRIVKENAGPNPQMSEYIDLALQK